MKLFSIPGLLVFLRCDEVGAFLGYSPKILPLARSTQQHGVDVVKIISRQSVTVMSGDEMPATGASIAFRAGAVAFTAVHSTCSGLPLFEKALGLDLLLAARNLAPLPIYWSIFNSLASASKVGWGRLGSATYRRLNLALASSMCWSTILMLQKGVPQSVIVKNTASTTLVGIALVSLIVWKKSQPVGEKLTLKNYVFRYVELLCGDVLQMISHPNAEEDSGSNIYTILSLSFAICAARCPTSPLAPFYFLTSVVCLVLRDAAQRGRGGASTFVSLQRGVVSWATILIGSASASLLYPGSSPLPLSSWAMGGASLVLALKPRGE